MVTTKPKSTVDTKDKNKRIKAYHYGKWSDHKGRWQEGIKWARELQNSQRRIR